MGKSLWYAYCHSMEFFCFGIAKKGRVGGCAVLCDLLLRLLVTLFGLMMGVVRLLPFFVSVLDAMSWMRFLMVRVVVCFPLSSDFRRLGACGHLLSLGLLLLVSSFHFVGGVDGLGLVATVALMMVIIAAVLLISL